jgi:hypothetical protein
VKETRESLESKKKKIIWKTNVEAAAVLWYNKTLVQHDVKQYCSSMWVVMGVFLSDKLGQKIWSLLGRCNHHNRSF